MSHRDLDALNRAVTSAIFKAEREPSAEAWEEVARCEQALADALPDGGERRIARRGVEAATRKAAELWMPDPTVAGGVVDGITGLPLTGPVVPEPVVIRDEWAVSGGKVPALGNGEVYKEIATWPEDWYRVAISKDGFETWKQEIVYPSGDRRPISDIDALCRRVESLLAIHDDLRRRVEEAVERWGYTVGTYANTQKRVIDVRPFMVALGAIFGERVEKTAPTPLPDRAACHFCGCGINLNTDGVRATVFRLPGDVPVFAHRVCIPEHEPAHDRRGTSARYSRVGGADR